jgi:Undecaprenyl-phosphate glucose phosphotransferase
MTAIVGEQVLPERRSLPIAFRHIAAVVHFTDAALIISASVVTGCLYRIVTNNVLGEIDQFAATGSLVAMMVVGFNVTRGLGNPEELLRPRKQMQNVVIAWLFALFIVLGMAFSWKVSSDFSRGAFLTFFPVGLLLMATDRLVWYRLLQTSLAQERLRVRKAAVLLGADQDREQVALQLDMLKRHGFLPLWQFTLPQVGDAEADQFAARFPDMIRGTNVEEVIILADWAGVNDVMGCLHKLPVPIRYLPVGTAQALCARPREVIGGSVLVELQRGSLSGAERAAKATFDKVAAALALLVLIPPMAFCAVLIKLESKGPVFFRQTRRGFNGRPFEIWKFRTMRVAENGPDVRQATVGDSRVTRVGRWLRRTSFDEVPQLINVLRGEMSIVGPRPHAMSHDDHYDRLIADYPRRQHVRPGLTGWAQVCGARGETPTIEHMKRRVEFDLWYVQNWTFWRDLWIIACTVWHVVSTRDAY